MAHHTADKWPGWKYYSVNPLEKIVLKGLGQESQNDHVEPRPSHPSLNYNYLSYGLKNQGPGNVGSLYSDPMPQFPH